MAFVFTSGEDCFLTAEESPSRLDLLSPGGIIHRQPMPAISSIDTRIAAGPDWRKTLTILFIGQLVTAMGFASFFPFLPFYVEQLGSSTGMSLAFLAGMTYSGQAMTMAIASPIWGSVADRYGRKLMLERAMFGGAVVLLLMAFAQSAEQLVILRAIQGLITGTIAAANAMAAAIVPRERMGFAMGMLQTGLGVGVAVGPMLGGAIADGFGYAAAFYVTAALLFFAGLLIWWGVEEQFQPPARDDRSHPGLWSQWKRVLSTPGIPDVYNLHFTSQMARTLILPIAPLFIALLMGDSAHLNTFTGLVTGAASATTTLSAIYLGRLGDRIGHRPVLIVGAAATAGIYALHFFTTAAWQLLALQALAGIAMGGILPAVGALLAQYSSASDSGAVYGLDNSVDAAARSIAPLLGAAVGVRLGLRAAFVVSAALFLALCALSAARLQRRPRQA
jgi:MFS transporter, DHA1 family, multidrug resistance protein